MDHLPRPRDAVMSELDRVPYVCQEEYDGGPFLTYPLRTDKADVLPAVIKLYFQTYEEIRPTPIRELEAFFQTWLFFGLLAEIFGKLFNPTDFICTVGTETGDERVLSTSKLIMVADTWVAEVKSAIDEQQNRYEHIVECLNMAAKALLAAPEKFDPSIKLSIAATGEFLTYAANKAFSVELEDDRSPAFCHLFPDLSRRMQESGWCPSEVHRCLETFFSIQALYYISKMQKQESGDRHQACTEHGCTAYQIELNDYQTQHYTTGCTCDEICLDGKEVIPILENGQLPLLRINGCGHSLNDISISVLGSESNLRYVALSHIWAEGLGNPRANALPRCQLSHLYSLLTELNRAAGSVDEDGELLLWIDTLCCPVKPPEAKTIALAKMRETYQQATHVLVLDASLRQYHSLDAVEACVRIFTSGWMRRLWTLQEGALATRLWFQFRDVPLNLRQLWKQMLSIFNLKIDLGHKGLAFDMVLAYLNLRKILYDKSHESGSDLFMIARALRHRSVSVSSDEPLCIATLMNLDLEEILAEPESRRMQKLWSLMPSDLRGIPSSIIFHGGPRLREQGYRWAPATLLRPIKVGNYYIRKIETEDSIGVPTAKGLKINLPGLIVSTSKAPKGLSKNPWDINAGKVESLYARDDQGDDTGIWYQMDDITEQVLHNNGPSSLEHPASGQPLGLSEETSAPQHPSLYEIIRDEPNGHVVLIQSDFEASADGLLQVRGGLLVKRKGDENGVASVQSMLHVRIGILNKAMSEMLEAAYQCACRLRQDKSTQQLAEMSDDQNGVDFPAYNEELNRLRQQIREQATEALKDDNLMETVSIISGREKANVTFQEHLTPLFMGFHGFIGAKFPSTQRWCVD